MRPASANSSKTAAAKLLALCGWHTRGFFFPFLLPAALHFLLRWHSNGLKIHKGDSGTSSYVGRDRTGWENLTDLRLFARKYWCTRRCGQPTSKLSVLACNKCLLPLVVHQEPKGRSMQWLLLLHRQTELLFLISVVLCNLSNLLHRGEERREKSQGKVWTLPRMFKSSTGRSGKAPLLSAHLCTSPSKCRVQRLPYQGGL